MTKIMISTLMMMMSMIMIFLNHPLSMGLTILIQTLLTCIITGMLIKTYWFSYILFLTFMGGLLVLFIYVTSIASNELFSTNLKMKTLLLIMFYLMLIISFLFMNNLNWMNLSNNSEMENMKEMSLFLNNENKFNLNKLYNQQTYLMTMLMIIYLFITLIAVVKITNIFFGPLRTSM
uniref:NADH-ubiquinone oxidoreductase chain 6 n=1 Tax=Dendrolimus houi TaxID=765132 RepID=A0A3G1H2Y1_9NEOP|nr:NADH dehydrogenase subunit 6 [Dendrolimus houi]AQM57861.1 NADH dehydrogenase subunit 6 [Dendrolimus houi]AQM57874.1 NADH dehydrogenase subunit 6 [Dendrolimus houi]UIX22017.1 NADH dehydrogenase subunit 6 [Dendrolimus houi]UKB89064.1 NADH dehydrogenase subunit 6 [Dendrolimus houi]